LTYVFLLREAPWRVYETIMFGIGNDRLFDNGRCFSRCPGDYQASCTQNGGRHAPDAGVERTEIKPGIRSAETALARSFKPFMGCMGGE
jgi:hypothetical protein